VANHGRLYRGERLLGSHFASCAGRLTQPRAGAYSATGNAFTAQRGGGALRDGAASWRFQGAARRAAFTRSSAPRTSAVRSPQTPLLHRDTATILPPLMRAWAALSPARSFLAGRVRFCEDLLLSACRADASALEVRASERGALVVLPAIAASARVVSALSFV